jgi:cytochrome P450
MSERSPAGGRPPRVDEPAGDHDLRAYLRHYLAHGPIFEAVVAGRPQVVLAGTEANAFMARAGGEALGHQVFWQDFDREEARQPVVRGGEGNRRRRAVLSRGYARGRVRDRLPDLAAMTQRAIEEWSPGSTVDFYPWVQRLVAEQLGRLLTGHGPGERFPDLVAFMHANMAAMTGARPRETLRSPAYRCARDRVFAMGRSIVDAHRGGRDPGRPPDLVDDVLAAAGEHPPSDDQLAHVVLGPFLAGLDTVSTMSSYLLHALLAHPEALARVRAEVDRAFSGPGTSWRRLPELPALLGAAMETLRRHPLAIGHDCEATRPFTFAGCRVDAGRPVFVAMAVPHFLPEIYPEPERFDIDRYRPPRSEHRRPGGWAPFGLGDRACLGAGLAQTQLAVIVGSALARFDLALDAPWPALEPYGASPAAAMRLRVHVVRRR